MIFTFHHEWFIKSLLLVRAFHIIKKKCFNDMVTYAWSFYYATIFYWITSPMTNYGRLRTTTTSSLYQIVSYYKLYISSDVTLITNVLLFTPLLLHQGTLYWYWVQRLNYVICPKIWVKWRRESESGGEWRHQHHSQHLRNMMNQTPHQAGRCGTSSIIYRESEKLYRLGKA